MFSRRVCYAGQEPETPRWPLVTGVHDPDSHDLGIIEAVKTTLLAGRVALAVKANLGRKR